MADVYGYHFNNVTRIGEGDCGLSMNNVQNAQAATYMLDNFRPACPMSSAIEFATSQPDINFTGSHQVGIGGCNIDQNSQLEGLDQGLMKPKCKISLFQRPFATVPYLGRGRSDPVLESQIQQGALGQNRKSVHPSSEITYETGTPLLPSLQATVANPANLVEGVAAQGWIRGGLPSRELTHDEDYAKYHTKHQYV